MTQLTMQLINFYSDIDLSHIYHRFSVMHARLLSSIVEHENKIYSVDSTYSIVHSVHSYYFPTPNSCFHISTHIRYFIQFHDM